MMLTLSFSTIIFIVFTYGIGSIPFGLIFTKLSGLGDIRNIGSGNIGATNVLRTGSRKLAVLTLVFDAGKGAVTVGVASYFADIHIAALAGLLTVIGHCYPIWLKFKGGKGVATSVAVFAALDIQLGGVFAIVWLSTAFLLRYSSLAALSAVLAVAVGGFILLDDMISQICILLIGGLVWTRHQSNIGRLLAGTETKIGAK
jgi:glycerol-3-phosphate acyltransferase PlsY